MGRSEANGDKLYTLEEIREKVKPIAAAYGVERVYLFGSYARGEATAESDLDFRIDKGKVKGFAFGGLINALWMHLVKMLMWSRQQV